MEKKNDIDRKITNYELEEYGLIVDGVEILPPVSEDTQKQKRFKKELEYYKLFGRIYYQVSDLILFAKRHKVEAAKR